MVSFIRPVGTVAYPHNQLAPFIPARKFGGVSHMNRMKSSTYELPHLGFYRKEPVDG